MQTIQSSVENKIEEQLRKQLGNDPTALENLKQLSESMLTIKKEINNQKKAKLSSKIQEEVAALKEKVENKNSELIKQIQQYQELTNQRDQINSKKLERTNAMNSNLDKLKTHAEIFFEWANFAFYLDNRRELMSESSSDDVDHSGYEEYDPYDDYGGYDGYEDNQQNNYYDQNKQSLFQKLERGEETKVQNNRENSNIDPIKGKQSDDQEAKKSSEEKKEDIGSSVQEFFGMTPEAVYYLHGLIVNYYNDKFEKELKEKIPKSIPLQKIKNTKDEMVFGFSFDINKPIEDQVTEDMLNFYNNIGVEENDLAFDKRPDFVNHIQELASIVTKYLSTSQDDSDEVPRILSHLTEELNGILAALKQAEQDLWDKAFRHLSHLQSPILSEINKFEEEILPAFELMKLSIIEVKEQAKQIVLFEQEIQKVDELKLKQEQNILEKMGQTIRTVGGVHKDANQKLMNLPESDKEAARLKTLRILLYAQILNIEEEEKENYSLKRDKISKNIEKIDQDIQSRFANLSDLLKKTLTWKSVDEWIYLEKLVSQKEIFIKASMPITPPKTLPKKLKVVTGFENSYASGKLKMGGSKEVLLKKPQKESEKAVLRAFEQLVNEGLHLEDIQLNNTHGQIGNSKLTGHRQHCTAKGASLHIIKIYLDKEEKGTATKSRGVYSYVDMLNNVFGLAFLGIINDEH